MQVPEQNCDVVKFLSYTVDFISYLLVFCESFKSSNLSMFVLSIFVGDRFYMYGYLVLQRISHING